LSILLFGSLISGCGQDKDDYVVTIKTQFGEMKALLYDETPLHKKNFIKLAEEGALDNTLFHRVIQEFMIQGGDPNSKTAVKGQPLGDGGPGYTVPAEINTNLLHERGALSAARLSDAQNPKKESSGSQFYIVQGKVWTKEELTLDQEKLYYGLQQILQNPSNKGLLDSLNQLYRADQTAFQKKVISLAPMIQQATNLDLNKTIEQSRLDLYTTIGGAPHLDGGYTVFGKVVKGLEVIDKIAAVAKDQSDRPLEDIRMTVKVEKMSKKKIEKEFGYQYPAKKP
jgi:peptidyl-prolyl cis-trans isomerase B (cyclophilin B)